MKPVRVYCTCPAWYWVVQWRWTDLLQSACCPQSEWLFLRSSCFGFPQSHPLPPPWDSHRQTPSLRLPSSWRCLRYSTGYCCDCSPPRCCWSRWGRFSEAAGCWPSMTSTHLVLHAHRHSNYSQKNLGHRPLGQHHIRNVCRWNYWHTLCILIGKFLCLWVLMYFTYGIYLCSCPVFVTSDLIQPD